MRDYALRVARYYGIALANASNNSERREISRRAYAHGQRLAQGKGWIFRQYTQRLHAYEQR